MRRTPLAKKKKTDRARAKEAAWKAFSLYIRTRDCLATTGKLTEGICCTCKRKYPIEKLQAGHFLAGRTNSVLFDERGVHAQSYGCNVGKNGAYVEYFIFMEERYGRAVIDEMRANKSKTVKYSIEDLIAIEEKYTRKYQELVDKHNRMLQ